MALRDQPYLPLYVQDFLTDEKLVECSAEATGVYIRLLCILHKSLEYGTILLKQKDKQTESKINNFALKLFKQMPYPMEVVENSLQELVNEDVLFIDGNRLGQKRMIHDNKLSLVRAKSGQKGGKSSHSKRNFAQAKTQANAETEYESETEVKSSIKKTIRYAPEFESFWALYPKKVAKPKAYQAWVKVAPSNGDLEKILEAVKKQRGSKDWAKNDGQYIPHPSVWLNNERWNDVIEKCESIEEIPEWLRTE